MPFETTPASIPALPRWFLHRLSRPAACALAALLAWGASAAWAEKADREQPMHIEADSMRYEDARNGQPRTATFTGHVVVTKGTIVMRGNQLVVRQDEAGNQSGVMTPAPGERAFFRQKREGVNEFIEGQSNRMEYDGKTDTVRLIGNAEMRRLVGATMVDDVTGALIVYNNNTEVYTVDRAPAASGKSGRVHAIMAPQSAASGPAGGAAKSVRPGASAALPLRPTSTLTPTRTSPSGAKGQR